MGVRSARVDALTKNEQGRVSGVVVRNVRDGSLREVKAKVKAEEDLDAKVTGRQQGAPGIAGGLVECIVP